MKDVFDYFFWFLIFSGICMFAPSLIHLYYMLTDEDYRLIMNTSPSMRAALKMAELELKKKNED